MRERPNLPFVFIRDTLLVPLEHANYVLLEEWKIFGVDVQTKLSPWTIEQQLRSRKK